MKRAKQRRWEASGAIGVASIVMVVARQRPSKQDKEMVLGDGTHINKQVLPQAPSPTMTSFRRISAMVCVKTSTK